ncbi:MAG: bacteriohopanetetrol glucosamine biosynthesis glycosyltransferase HpnI [Elusimicrobia bacterium]|nr:bacteriohopanetetrol glucosamine biosynthesis glycosyltransferase HpnI [Elusimicrobiota bacterium]
MTGATLEFLTAVVPSAVETALRLFAVFTGACTIAFSAASVAAARRQWRARTATPDVPEDRLPPVTILKPLKGADSGMYASLSSFLALDYPRFQVLFALQSPDDPSLTVLKQLRKDFPAADFEIVISKNRIGYNPKVNNLSNAYPFAKHELLLISDSDIQVGRDFLRKAVAPFQDPAIGMTTCYYRSAPASSLGGLLEAASINTQFLPQALVAGQLLGVRFAMGAAMLVRRRVFDALGGFQALSDHLADDFVLGAAVRAGGHRLEFSTPLVDSHPGSPTLKEHLVHSARWARTIRVCQPAGYAGLVVIQGFALLSLHLCLFGADRLTAAFWAAVALARVASAAWSHVAYLDNPSILRQLHVVLLSDLTQFVIWITGFKSKTVLWRGEYYHIQVGGRLVPRKARSGVAVATPT